MYREIQRRLPWWIYLITIGLTLAGFAFSIFLFLKSNTIAEIQESILASLLVILVPVICILLIFSIRLEVMIGGEGISYRLFPFHMKLRHIAWTEIVHAEVRKYKPLAEFGGWGIRFNTRRKETAYTIAGDTGLELELKSGKKILIGTEKPVETGDALRLYFRTTENS